MTDSFLRIPPFPGHRAKSIAVPDRCAALEPTEAGKLVRLLRHHRVGGTFWAARPSVPASIKDDLLVRLYALDSVDIEPLRTDLMARLEHHRDRFERYERLLNKRFPDGTAPPADLGKLLSLRIGLTHERAVAEWCEEAIEALSALTVGAERTNVVAIEEGQRGNRENNS